MTQRTRGATVPCTGQVPWRGCFGSTKLRFALALLAVWAFASGCISVNIGSPGRGELEETLVHGRRGPKILLLDIEGAITEHERMGLLEASRESTVARVVEQLDRAARSGDIRGVLLRVDSPGGTASASDDIYRALANFKRRQQIPVIAQFMGLAASGGYYVAMAADEIYAEPTTVTGSIGVLFMGISFEGLMDRFGVRDQTITGGEHKDAGSFLRDMTAEEEAHLQSVVDDLHDRFKEVVQAGRPGLEAADVDRLADGSIFSAKQAEAEGLIDSIRPLEETTEHCARVAGIVGDYRVVTYHRPGEYRDNLHTRTPLPPPTTSSGGDLSALLDRTGLGRPGFHYLWWPAAQ